MTPLIIYHYTTPVMIAEINNRAIDYRIVQRGLESYWKIDGNPYLLPILDNPLMGMIDRDTGHVVKITDQMQFVDSVALQFKQSNSYWFYYGHDEQAEHVKQIDGYSTLEQAIQSVNLSYDIGVLHYDGNEPLALFTITWGELLPGSDQHFGFYYNGRLCFMYNWDEWDSVMQLVKSIAARYELTPDFESKRLVKSA